MNLSSIIGVGEGLNTLADQLPDHSKKITIDYVRIFLHSIVLLLGLYLQVKIYKLMQLNQISLSLAILSINLAIVSDILATIFGIKADQTTDNSLMNYYYNLFIIFDDLKVMLSFSAYMFTLYRWGLFVINYKFSDAPLTQRKYKRTLAIVTAVL